MALCIGVDLGGTNVAAGVVNEEGVVLNMDKRPLGQARGRDVALENIGACIQKAIDDAEAPDRIEKIGIGSPAPIDVFRGVIATPVNMKVLHDTPIKKILQDRFGKKVFLDNDANIAAIGEHWMGAGRGTENFICLTLGTGIGGGIIADGRILRGAGGHAGEIGHMSIEHDGPVCTCTNHGCFELYASATAIAKRTRNLIIQENPKTLIRELVNKDLTQITAEVVYQAARAGDQFAVDVYRETGYFLGCGAASLLALFNPEVIAVTGGVARAGDLLIKPAMEVLDERRWVDKKLNPARLVMGELGDDGAILGAAKMAMDREK